MQEGLPSNATEVLDLWRRIANGTADDATVLAWARHVAQNIVELEDAENIEANARAQRMRAAVGLRGRVDELAELRELAKLDYPAKFLASAADLIVDTGGKTPSQIKRTIEYERSKNKQ